MKRTLLVVASALGVFFGSFLLAQAASIFLVQQGGTGVGTFTSGQLIYGNGTNNLTSVATTSVTCTGSTSCTSFTAIGPSPITITSTGVGSGLATTSPVSNSNVLTYSSAGAGSAYGTATTSHAFSGPFTITGILGALVGGSNSTVTWNGLATTSQPASSNLLTSNGTSGVYGTATSTLTATGPLTGSFTQVGSGGTLGCTTAASGVAGCLSNTAFDTFNNKQATISVTWPITLSGATVGFNGLSTSTAAVIGNIPYFSGLNTFANVATSSLALGTGLNLSAGSLGAQIGGSAATIKLADTAVTPGSYTNSNITVDQQGRITSASNGATGSGGAIGTSTALVAGQVDFSSSVNTIANDASFLFDSVLKKFTAQNASTTWLTSNGIDIGASTRSLLRGDNATSTFDGPLIVHGASTGQLEFGNFSGITTAAANDAAIMRTDGSGAYPFNNGGSVVIRPRISSTAGRGSIYLYTGSPSTEAVHIDETQKVGIGSTTPGSLLSIGATGVGTNFFSNGTTTKDGVGGYNITQGCYALNGTCITGTGGTPGGSSGQLQYNASGSFGGTATTTLVAGTNISFGGATPVILGASPITISATGGGTGLSTTSPISGSNVLVYSSAGAGSAYGVATSSLAVGASLSSSGTLGSQIGGTNTSLSLNLANPNSWTALQQFTQASTSLLSVTGTAYFGSTSTTTIDNAGIHVPSGSSINVGGLSGCLTASLGTISSLGTACGSGTVNSGLAGQNAFYAANGTAVSATSTIFISPQSYVGIGTTTPLYPLDVAGAINTSKWGGYYQDYNLILTASSTLHSTVGGIGAGVALRAANAGNTVFGYQALSKATSTTGQTAFGDSALKNAIDGSGYSTAFGNGALTANTTGADNTAVGHQSSLSNTTGRFNTSIGGDSFFSNTTGGYNTAIGEDTLYSNNGDGNVAVGDNALGNQGLANYNIGIGYQSAATVSTGYSNIFIGSDPAGLNSITSGSNNIGIGYAPLFRSATANNQINIGNTIFGTRVATTTTLGAIDFTTALIGVATTSPGSLFSIGSTTGINFGLATSTFSTTGGINLTQGCFAIAGTCIGGGTGTPGGSSGQLQYNASGAFGGTATTTLVAGTNISFGGATPVILGSSPITISATGGGTGLSTTSPIAAGNLLFYNGTGAGSASGVATSTLTLGTGLTYTGTLGALVGGASGTLNTPWTTTGNNIANNNSGNVGIGTTTPWARLSVSSTGALTAGSKLFDIGSTTKADLFNVDTSGNIHVGIDGAICPLGLAGNLAVGLEICGSTGVAGGLVAQIENYSNSSTAFSGLNFDNDQSSSALTFAGLFMNSSTYNYTGYGTALAVPSQLSIEDTQGQIAFVAASTSPNGAFFNWFNGGANLNNETMRLIANGNLGVGTTSPSAHLSIDTASSTPTEASFRVADRGATLLNLATTTQTALQSGDIKGFGIGTSSPDATFSAIAASSTANAAPLFDFWGIINAINYAFLRIDSWGHAIMAGPAPVCDANCTFVAGNDNAFRVNLGSSITSSTVTFSHAWGALAPICVANEGSAGTVDVSASSTPTTVVLTALSALTSKDVEVQCVGIQ